MVQCNKQQITSTQKTKRNTIHISYNTFKEHSGLKESMSLQDWSNSIQECGENDIIFLYLGADVGVYKKSTGWDTETLWLKFGRKDEVFQWVLSDDDPVDLISSANISCAPSIDTEENIFWNFIVRETDPSDDWTCSDKIDVMFFSGSEPILGYSPVRQLHVSWNGDGLRYETTYTCRSDDFADEFYSQAYSLAELPNSTQTPENVDGWTQLDESDDPLDFSGVNKDETDLMKLSTVSVQTLIDENKKLKEELETKNLMIQHLTEGSSSESTDDSEYTDDQDDYDEYADEIYQERRIDPFDKEFYTKDEFLDYYGYDGFGEAMWGMNAPEKISKVLMYEWILSRNSEVLNTKSKNYLMDKMIAVLL